MVVWADTIFNVLTYIPLPPGPQIVLPTIRATMMGAAPQTIEPTSKTTIDEMKSVLLLNNP